MNESTYMFLGLNEKELLDKNELNMIEAERTKIKASKKIADIERTLKSKI